MSSLSVAVVGGGHLGRIHARLLAEHSQAKLSAIVEPNAETRTALAEDFNVPILEDCRLLDGKTKAAIVAAPTFLHYDIGCQLLTRGLHVLMEKPLSTTRDEADELIELAAKQKCILQVGHVERFNPVVAVAKPLLPSPKYIEARRLSGFSFRSMDIGVVLDLMIHDIDIVLSLVHGNVTSVHALGAVVLGGHEDMAQARLSFDTGCVVNLTASRTAIQSERSMGVYCPTGYAKIDFAAGTVNIVRPHAKLLDGTWDTHSQSKSQRAYFRDHLFETLLPMESLSVPKCNPILEEQRDFVASIRNGRPPVVSGQAGRNAVAIAEQILESIESHSWNGTELGPMGAQAMFRPTILQTPMAHPAATLRRRRAG